MRNSDILSIYACFAYIVINYFSRKLFPFETVKTLPGPERLPLINTLYTFLQQKSEGIFILFLF